MEWRSEQCRKVCRIIDNSLANRPAERDSLIVATRKAFEALEGSHWIPCSERLPETDNFRTGFEVTYKTENGKYKVTSMKWENTVVRGKKVSRWIWNDRIAPWKVVAWKPFSEPYQEGEQNGWLNQQTEGD